MTFSSCTYTTFRCLSIQTEPSPLLTAVTSHILNSKSESRSLHYNRATYRLSLSAVNVAPLVLSSPVPRIHDGSRPATTSSGKRPNERRAAVIVAAVLVTDASTLRILAEVVPEIAADLIGIGNPGVGPGLVATGPVVGELVGAALVGVNVIGHESGKEDC